MMWGLIKDSTELGYRNPPMKPNFFSRQYPDKKIALSGEVYNDQQGTSSPFPKVDPSTLPPVSYPDKKIALSGEVYNDQQGTSSPFPKVDPITLLPVSYDDPLSAILDGVPVGEMATVTTVSGASYVTTTSSATPVLYAYVPIDNQSGAGPGTTEANLGKLDVNNLRKGLAKKQETTKHIELPSGNQADKRDLNSLKSNLEKKEVRAKVEGLNEGDYENLIPLHQEATRSQTYNPSKKAPRPTPRFKETVPGESSVAFHEHHFADSEKNFKMWRCVDCHCMNQVSSTKCIRCSKPQKNWVQGFIRRICDFCDLMFFYRKDEDDIVCPNCYTPLVTVV